MPFFFPYLSRQPGPYLSACCLVPSWASWPLAIPQSPSCQLLYPLFHLLPLSFCKLSKLSTSVSNALSLEACPDLSVSLSLSPQELSTLLLFFSIFFAFVLTFSFNLWACPPSPAWPHFKFAYHLLIFLFLDIYSYSSVDTIITCTCSHLQSHIAVVRQVMPILMKDICIHNLNILLLKIHPEAPEHYLY